MSPVGIYPNRASFSLLRSRFLGCHPKKRLRRRLGLITLSQFCRDWRMNINTQKKSHDISKFFINGENVEITNSYSYLGARFSRLTTNGSFKENKAILKEKTRRSFFETRRHLDFLKLPVDIINKIFNSLYLPILMYGSEVWSIMYL